MATINDDGTLPRHYDPETNEVVFDVPEIPAEAELADLIAALETLGLITVAEEG